jgi:hypothetical protein
MMNLVQAVEYAGQIRNGVRVSDVSNFDDLHEAYGDRFTLSGTGYLADLVHAFVGLDPVEVTDPPASLTVAAARSGARGAVLVVNTRWRGAVTANLQAPGRGGVSCGTFRTLAADPGRPTRAARPPAAVRPADDPTDLARGHAEPSLPRALGDAADLPAPDGRRLLSPTSPAR